MIKISSSEITPEHIYVSRRKFMKGVGALAAGSILAACGVQEPVATAPPVTEANPEEPKPGPTQAEAETPAETDELGDSFTSYEAVTTYNNFYEFTNW